MARGNFKWNIIGGTQGVPSLGVLLGSCSAYPACRTQGELRRGEDSHVVWTASNVNKIRCVHQTGSTSTRVVTMVSLPVLAG
jgi:hypothetical protein